MPNVPVYSTPQAAPDALAGVRQQTPYRLMQAAEIGPGQTVKAGRAMLEAGGELLKEATATQIQQNEAAAKEHDAGLMGAIQGVLYGAPGDPTSGYLNQKGKNAVDAYGATVDKLNALAKDQSQTLQNPAQQEMVRTPTQIRVQAAVADAAKHMSQQSTVYNIAAGQTRIKVAQDGAALAYNPITDSPAPAFDHDNPGANSLYQQSLQTIVSEANALADQQGMTDPDLRAALVRDSLTKAYIGTLGHMIDKKAGAPGDIKVAQAYFDKVKDQLPADAQDKIRAVLETGAQKDQALNVALDVKGRVAGIDAQEKELDAQFKAGKITGEVHEMALQKLRADNSQRRAEQGENDRAMLGNIWDLARKGGNITDLSPTQLAYVKQRGLGPNVDAMFNRADKASFDDSQQYADLMRMSADDPAGFTSMDLAKFSGQLTQAHWNHLVGVQTSINRQDVKAMEANKVVHTAIQDTKAQLLAAGFNMNPKPNTSDANKLAQFETSLRDALVAAQQDRKDKPLTRDEARAITMGMLKDHALTGTGYFGTSVGQTHVPVWQMSPEQRAANWEIPQDERAQISASLTKAGLSITEVNIQRAYKLAKGVR